MDGQIQVDETVEKFGGLVYQLALTQTKNTADAEDVFQEVFLRLVRTEQKFESDEHLKAWLIRVTINCSHSLWRSAWHQKVIPLDDEIFDEQEQHNEQSDLYGQVLSLPKKYRTVIHLFYYEDMSIENISHTLNVGYDAVAKRLSRARKLLKEQLSGGDDYEELSNRIPIKRKPAPGSR